MSTLCRAGWEWQKYAGAEKSESPFFCPIHLSAILPLFGGLVVRGLIGPQKIKVNQGKSSLIKVNQGILKHFFCGERDRPGRGAGRLAPHLPGQDVLGEAPNTARGTHALPIQIHRFCQTNASCRDGRADLSVVAEAGQRHGNQRLSWSDSTDHHSSDTFFCPIHLSAIHSKLILVHHWGLTRKTEFLHWKRFRLALPNTDCPVGLRQSGSKWVKPIWGKAKC